MYKAPKLQRRYGVVDCVVFVELSTASSYCIRHLLHCVFFIVLLESVHNYDAKHTKIIFAIKIKIKIDGETNSFCT